MSLSSGKKMIGALNGCPMSFDNGVLSLACGGVVYEINVGSPPSWIYSSHEPGKEDQDVIGASLFYWIHYSQPEKGPPELYGFREKDERDAFRRLLQIDGIGCKVAMRIVTAKAVYSTFSIGETPIARAYVAVPSTLQAVRGVGPKLYERIIEELSK